MPEAHQQPLPPPPTKPASLGKGSKDSPKDKGWEAIWDERTHALRSRGVAPESLHHQHHQSPASLSPQHRSQVSHGLAQPLAQGPGASVLESGRGSSAAGSGGPGEAGVLGVAFCLRGEGKFVLSAVHSGLPASGRVAVGDALLELDGQLLSASMSLDELVARMQGAVGEQVRLTLARPSIGSMLGYGERYEVVLVREAMPRGSGSNAYSSARVIQSTSASQQRGVTRSSAPGTPQTLSSGVAGGGGVDVGVGVGRAHRAYQQGGYGTAEIFFREKRAQQGRERGGCGRLCM